eukprot:1152336-Rhodomonas_salina.1
MAAPGSLTPSQSQTSHGESVARYGDATREREHDGGKECISERGCCQLFAPQMACSGRNQQIRPP